MNLAAIFAALAASVPSRVLAALGMGFVTFAGYSALVSSLVSAVQSQWSGLAVDLLSYLTLAGFTQGLGIYLGGIVAGLVVQTLPKLMRLPSA